MSTAAVTVTVRSDRRRVADDRDGLAAAALAAELDAHVAALARRWQAVRGR